MSPRQLTPQAEITEAPKPAMVDTSGQFGMHIASYRKIAQARLGWMEIKKAYPFMMKDMTPLVSRVRFNDGRGNFYRLVAGPIAEKSVAMDECRIIKVNFGYCSVIDYQGTVLK